MKFRPCIDIHNGKVKQIIGGSLKDQGDRAVENFVAGHDASYFAELYREHRLTGGHIILLNHRGSEYFEATKKQALSALHAYPGGLQIGGGIQADNAYEYIEAGASHVIVTSYVFQNGEVNFDHLEKIERAVGKEHLVLDLSCRVKGEKYVVVTDRWQKDTNYEITEENLDNFARFSNEFLIHAVDVEGKMGGIDGKLAKILGDWGKIPVTYAGGVSSLEDLEKLRETGKDKLDVTIGSALSLFGGPMDFEKVLSYFDSLNSENRIS